MHSPYIVGRWVRGREHYDRQSLINYLLSSADSAIWLVGTRRIGKTSLLRQIELLTEQAESHFFPLFWDLQGCTTVEELAAELSLSLQDATDRFADVGIDLESADRLDSNATLRWLGRRLNHVGKELLLLIDEAEVLIDLLEKESSWLARLRKVVQEGRLRTIIASTDRLSQLIEQSSDWTTSPFLFGFHMVKLWTLRRDGAIALVRQNQSTPQVVADEETVEQILDLTGCHPFLIQYLCQRLYAGEQEGVPCLRPVEPADLAIDHMLAGFFLVDFQQMTALGQAVMCTLTARGPQTEAELTMQTAGNFRGNLRRVLTDLNELGHIRHRGERWEIGNAFLARWLQEHREELELRLQGKRSLELNEPLSDQNIHEIAHSLHVPTTRLHEFSLMQVQSEAELYAAVKRMVLEIRHLVEQDDGHRLLSTTDSSGKRVLRSEEEIQIALKHWFKPMCGALNIEMDRESQTGRGLLDFKFSIGRHTRCLVEVKLFHSNKVLDGVSIQLPIYLMAERCRYGIYVPVIAEQTDYAATLQTLHQLAAERLLSHDLTLEVIDLRAWKPASASKAASVEERDRYLFPMPAWAGGRI
ncbi:MAG: hypothetical protein H3C34_15735 [Caldilineaceae bacterium]|nr:hypothetical protein [Caldilineaceae bacterium]